MIDEMVVANHFIHATVMNHKKRRHSFPSKQKLDDPPNKKSSPKIHVEKVSVTVRMRPPNKNEKNCNHFVCLDNCVLVKGAITERRYEFDHVFGPDATQHEVYEAVAAKLVRDVPKGINACIIAYGQTGAGKTYTLTELNEDEKKNGILPRAVKDLFQLLEDEKDLFDYKIKLSYLQIYMEQIQDLLKPENTNLQIREVNNRMYVDGLSEHYVRSLRDVMLLLKYGSRSRMVAQTSYNGSSSRSHTVFIINVERTDLRTNIVYKGTFTCIDLAGSERPMKSQLDGILLEEAKSINLSLSSLGNVIAILAEPNSKNKHIPWRDSKLTRLLRDILGGNCSISLIINIGPDDSNYQETVTSLLFGRRAMNVSQKTLVNQQQGEENLLLLKEKEKYERWYKDAMRKNFMLSQTLKSMQEKMKEYDNLLRVIISGDKMLNMSQREEISEMLSITQETQTDPVNSDNEMKEKYEELNKKLQQAQEMNVIFLKEDEKLNKKIATLYNLLVNYRMKLCAKEEELSKLQSQRGKRDDKLDDIIQLLLDSKIIGSYTGEGAIPSENVVYQLLLQLQEREKAIEILVHLMKQMQLTIKVERLKSNITSPIKSEDVDQKLKKFNRLHTLEEVISHIKETIDSPLLKHSPVENEESPMSEWLFNLNQKYEDMSTELETLRLKFKEKDAQLEEMKQFCNQYKLLSIEMLEKQVSQTGKELSTSPKQTIELTKSKMKDGEDNILQSTKLSEDIKISILEPPKILSDEELVEEAGLSVKSLPEKLPSQTPNNEDTVRIERLRFSTSPKRDRIRKKSAPLSSIFPSVLERNLERSMEKKDVVSMVVPNSMSCKNMMQTLPVSPSPQRSMKPLKKSPLKSITIFNISPPKQSSIEAQELELEQLQREIDSMKAEYMMSTSNKNM